MRRFLVICAGSLAAGFAAPAAVAQDREVPYWASLRSAEVNMRAGPSEAYPIEWVYHRQGLPVKVVRVNQGWRLVEDPEGTRGWIVARLLNPARGAIVTGEEPAEMREQPARGSRLRWTVEPGVVGTLGACQNGWCRLDAGGHKGWIRAERLWGAGEP